MFLDRLAGGAAGEQSDDTEEKDGSDQSLGPEAVDAPLLQDKGFKVAEEAGAEGADLGEFEEKPPAAQKGEHGEEGIAGDADQGDGNVRGAGLFVEGAGREDGETAVVDGAAVEALRDGAGRSEAGVHVVDAQGH